MTSSLQVSTRKGLLILDHAGGNAWEKRSFSFPGQPISQTFHDPGSGRLYACPNLGHFGQKLHVSEDQGETWNEIPAPAFPDTGEEGGPSVDQVWALEAGGDRLWAGTIPGGLFTSDDQGVSWSLNEPLWNLPERELWQGGGFDDPGLHSICIDPRNSDHVHVAISIGGVWKTEDGGKSWAPRTEGMYAEYVPPSEKHVPALQDPHRVVQSPTDPQVMWTQHHNAAFVSTDGGLNWNDLPNVPPSTFGFPVAVHPTDPKTAWFVPAEDSFYRMPAKGRVTVARTRDGGETFESLSNGLPQEDAFDLVYRHALDVDGTGELLAMGSTTGNLWTSENGGDSWELVNGHLPPIYSVRFVEFA